VYCEKNQTDSEKKICEGTLKTNNELGETLFAYFDYLFRRHPNFLVSTVAGVVVASKNKIFEDGGMWSRLSEKEQLPLMRLVVKNFKTYMDDNTKVLKAQQEHNRKQRAVIVELALVRAKTLFAKRVKYHGMGKDAPRTYAALLELYNKKKSDSGRTQFLKDQMNIRILGFDWENYKTHFSKDYKKRPLKQVLAHFKKLMNKEKRTPPKDAPVPSLKMREQPVLLERTKQRQQFETKGSEYEENIKTTYLEALETDGDGVANRILVETPEMSDLVGKRVAFKWDEPWGWSEGTVLKIADGKTKMSKKSRKVLEFDWAYIKYADQKDPYWNQLRANWFNTEKRAGWKLVA
jgi:hypothetical protein